jgi:prepilin-type N-terminal cleavage/methylation domain-containing protein
MNRRLHSRLERIRKDGDRGFTLTELLIAMGIFAVVLVVFMQAVAVMAKTTVRTQAQSDSADQLRNVFLRLDKEVRYAQDINTPATSNGAIYVEYWVPDNTASGASQCVQWRYVIASNTLQRRTWNQGDASSVTGWITMATKLRNDLSSSAQQPFTVTRAGTTGSKVYLHQRLDVFLSSGMGSGTDARGSQLSTTFVAQNSSTGSLTNSGTQNVCLIGTVQRP